MKTNLDLVKLFDTLSSQNIQINPFYIKISGSIVGGYFLTQLIYLYKGPYKYQEFYKRDDYFYEKLLMSEWELRSQKKKLHQLGLVNVRYGKDKKTHYTPDIEKIIQLAVDNSVITSLVNEDSSDSLTRNPRLVNEESSDTSIRTPKTTPKKNYINNIGDVDNLKSFRAAVPKKSENKMDGRPYIQCELLEIQGLTVKDIKQILEYPEYLIQDILRSYRRNRASVKRVAQYFLCSLEKRKKSDESQHIQKQSSEQR